MRAHEFLTIEEWEGIYSPGDDGMLGPFYVRKRTLRNANAASYFRKVHNMNSSGKTAQGKKNDCK